MNTNGKYKTREAWNKNNTFLSWQDDGGGLAFQLGRPGGGAPLRDSAGQLKTRRYNIDNTTGTVAHCLQQQYPMLALIPHNVNAKDILLFYSP